YTTQQLCLLSNPPPTAAIYPLSLHDALPISIWGMSHAIAKTRHAPNAPAVKRMGFIPFSPLSAPLCHPLRPITMAMAAPMHQKRSEEHTSELQSPYDLVCRLLLEKKKKNEAR